MIACIGTGTDPIGNGWCEDTSTASTYDDFEMCYLVPTRVDNYDRPIIIPTIFDLPLKGWATNYYFPNTPPFKLKYESKPIIFNHKILKQPISKSGFKRGQRR